MPNAFISAGRDSARFPLKAFSASIIGRDDPSKSAAPASARYSRRRENEQDTVIAKIPKTISNRFETSRMLILDISFERDLANRCVRSLDRKKTNVFKTPCNNVIVTMSPFLICDISWAKTARISFLFIVAISPVETATKAEFLNAPVAKALGSPL